MEIQSFDDATRATTVLTLNGGGGRFDSQFQVLGDQKNLKIYQVDVPEKWTAQGHCMMHMQLRFDG